MADAPNVVTKAIVIGADQGIRSLGRRFCLFAGREDVVSDAIEGLALFVAILLKREDKKKGYGLELPNIK